MLFRSRDSAYQKIEDLKGSNFGLVDPNSTSGNNVPRYALNRMGINPEQFFGKVVYTGSHENAVIALQQAQRHLSGSEPSLELALTGKIVAELEWDVLQLTRT